MQLVTCVEGDRVIQKQKHDSIVVLDVLAPFLYDFKSTVAQHSAHRQLPKQLHNTGKTVLISVKYIKLV